MQIYFLFSCIIQKKAVILRAKLLEYEKNGFYGVRCYEYSGLCTE